MPEKFQVNYGELQGIGQRFSRQSDEIGILIRRMEAGILDLQHSWSGHGAAAFFGEMDGTVLPGVKRLQQALGQASEACGKIAQVIRQAEEEAGGIVKNGGGTTSTNQPGGSSSGGDSSGSSSSGGDSTGHSSSGDGSSPGSASGHSPSGDGSSPGSASGGGSAGSAGGGSSAGGGGGGSAGSSSGGGGGSAGGSSGGGGGGGSSGFNSFSPSGSSGAFGAATSSGWQGVMSSVNSGGPAQQPFNQLVQSIKSINPQGASEAFQGILKAAPGLAAGDASPLLGQALSQAFPLQGVAIPTTQQGLTDYINQLTGSMGLQMGTSGFASFFDAILHAIVSMVTGGPTST
jgi:WXG100 family type VII secretion target